MQATYLTGDYSKNLIKIQFQEGEKPEQVEIDRAAMQEIERQIVKTCQRLGTGFDCRLYAPKIDADDAIQFVVEWVDAEGKSQDKKMSARVFLHTQKEYEPHLFRVGRVFSVKGDDDSE